jgi:putative oxidoreductase
MKTHESIQGELKMKYILLLGRILYSIIFLLSSVTLFSKPSINYAASHQVPMASIFVPIAGILILLGGISILLGYKARWGAWLIVIFLVPVTLIIHRFWGISDPMRATLQQIMFLKNTAMLGGALMIAYFGSGPLSLDQKKTTKSVAKKRS